MFDIEPPYQLIEWLLRSRRMTGDGRPDCKNRKVTRFPRLRSSVLGHERSEFSGAIMVQLGWNGWIVCSRWTFSGCLHREDGRILPPWKGCSVLPSNSKSDALSIELRVRGEMHYTAEGKLVNFRGLFP